MTLVSDMQYHRRPQMYVPFVVVDNGPFPVHYLSSDFEHW